MNSSSLTLLVATSSGIAAVLCGSGCDFDTALAPRIAMDVSIEGDGTMRHTTDLGYEVDLARCRVAIDTVEFTTDGEMHASVDVSPIVWAFVDFLIPTAYAHPGHAAGGEIVGELVGRRVFDWLANDTLGVADLTTARYSGANFTFARAEVVDGVDPADPIVGHTFDIGGTASKAGASVAFDARLDQDEGRRVVGLAFELDVDTNTQASLALALSPTDSVTFDTLFDGIDFFALDHDGDGRVTIEPDTEGHSRLRRSFQVHDRYQVIVR